MAPRDQLPAVPVSPSLTLATPMIPQNYSHPGMSIQQLLAISKAFWKQSLIIAAVFSLLVAAAGLSKPKTYVATATLIINPEVNDPISGKEFPVQLLGGYMATQLELISSSVVLQLVVEKLKLHENEDYAGKLSLPEDVRRAAAERELQANLGVTQGRYGSQLVYLSYTANSPVEAADTVNTISDVYVSRDYERRSPDAEKTSRAYAEQVELLKEKVIQAQATLTAFQKRTGIINTEGAGSGSDASLARLEGELLDARSRRRALEVNAASGPTDSTEGASAAQLAALRAQLGELEAKMTEYRITDGAKNPRVIELQSQIDSTRRSIAKTSSGVSSSTSTDLANARKLEAKILAAIEDQGRQVIAQSQLREEGEKYRVELESQQATYRRAFEKYDEIARSTTSSYNNIKLISRATPPTRASSRRTRTTLLMAVVLGGGAGVVLPLIWGLLNRRVRCRDDIERDYGIPVLIEFNAIPAR